MAKILKLVKILYNKCKLHGEHVTNDLHCC